MMTTKKTFEDLVRENKELREVIADGKKQKVGWLVTTPNIAYEGKTYEIDFENGHGFVIESEVYPRFANKLDERNTAAWQNDPIKHPNIEKEIAEYNTAGEKASSTLLANQLVIDCGYTSEYFGADEEDRLKARIAELDQAAAIEIANRKEAADSIGRSLYGRDNWIG